MLDLGRFSDDGGRTLKSIGDVDDEIGLWWPRFGESDESGRSEAVEDLGDWCESLADLLADPLPLELILWSLVPWPFIRSVSILLQARVNIASGSHFSSYWNKERKLLTPSLGTTATRKVIV